MGAADDLRAKLIRNVDEVGLLGGGP